MINTSFMLRCSAIFLHKILDVLERIHILLNVQINLFFKLLLHVFLYFTQEFLIIEHIHTIRKQFVLLILEQPRLLLLMVSPLLIVFFLELHVFYGLNLKEIDVLLFDEHAIFILKFLVVSI